MTEQTQETREVEPFDLFRRRIFEILSKPIEQVPEDQILKGLTLEQSTLFFAIEKSGEALMLDSAMDISLMAMDGIAATLLQIYRDGAMPGQLQSKPMQELADALIRLRDLEQHYRVEAVEEPSRDSDG